MKIARISQLLVSSVFLLSCSNMQQFESAFKRDKAPQEQSKQESVADNTDSESASSQQQSTSNVDDIVKQEMLDTDTAQANMARSSRPGSDEIRGNIPKRSEEKQQQLVSQAKKLVTNGSLPKLKARSRIEVPQVRQINGQDEVQLDYEQIEVRQILEELADALGMSIVIDPSISGKITMRTSPNQPLKHKDLWPVLNMLLNEAGITLEKKAGLYYAKKSQLFLPQEVGYPSILSDPNVSVALQITPLKYISASNALTVLKPIIGTKSKISQMSQLNMLAIIGSAEQLSRINGLISLIDVDPFKHRGIRLYKIKDTEAKEVAKELKDVLKLIEGDKAAYEVLGLERINALLVVAPPLRGFKAVDRWVNILDEGADEGLQEQIFIYHCKSIKCETLASTLNSIFDKPDTSKKNGSKKEDKANAPNVFRTVPKDELRVPSQKTSKDKKDTKTTAKNTQKKNTSSSSEGSASANIEVTIVADEDTNTLIVRTTGKDYRHLLETIKMLDQVPLQVLINVVIAQVTLSDDKEFGVDWTYATDEAAATLLARSGVDLGTSIISSSGLTATRVTDNFYGKVVASDKAQDIHILSRPSLLITNNQEGKINVGKEVPVQTGETVNTDSTTVTNQVSYRKTGIEMTMTPHINDDGIIHLEITQSLSSVEGSTSSQAATLQPTFTNQEITTTAVMEDGETIILGGLIENSNSKSDNGIPLLKDLPVAGNLFKTTTDENERRELLLVITPKIIGLNNELGRVNAEFKARFDNVAKYLDDELKGAY